MEWPARVVHGTKGAVDDETRVMGWGWDVGANAARFHPSIHPSIWLDGGGGPRTQLRAHYTCEVTGNARQVEAMYPLGTYGHFLAKRN